MESDMCDGDPQETVHAKIVDESLRAHLIDAGVEDFPGLYLYHAPRKAIFDIGSLVIFWYIQVDLDLACMANRAER